MRDLQDLRDMARSAPSSLSADEKNWLLAERLGIQEAASYRPTVHEAITEPAGPVRHASAPTVTEVISPPGYYDPDEHLGPNQGGTRFMRRITKSHKRKELNPLAHENMLRIAAYLWDRNPLASRVIKRAVNYVLGEGVKVVARHDDPKQQEAIQKVIDDFWYDQRNRLDRRLLRWCISWRAYGELAFKVKVTKANGRVRLAYISPEMIMEVKTEPDDVEQLTQLRLRVKDNDTEGQLFDVVRADREGEELDTLYKKEDPDPATSGPRRARATDRAHGECFYFATNVLPDMVRGRSDLLSIADIIDGYDQFVWNRMERQALLLAFVWSVTLSGMSEDEIKKWINEHPGVPKPGSVQVGNDKVKWEAISPSLGSGEAQMESDLLLNFIATSQGMPAMWFGEEQDPNRANGENLTGPTLKDLRGLQDEFKEVVSSLIYMVIDQAVIAGVLPTDTVTREVFEVQMPDLSVRDMAQAANTLQTLANACATARQYETLDLATSQELMVLALAPAGIDIKITELRERIKKDQKELQKKQEAEQMQAYAEQEDQTWAEQVRNAENKEHEAGLSMQQEEHRAALNPPLSVQPGGKKKTGPPGSERRKV